MLDSFELSPQPCIHPQVTVPTCRIPIPSPAPLRRGLAFSTSSRVFTWSLSETPPLVLDISAALLSRMLSIGTLPSQTALPIPLAASVFPLADDARPRPLRLSSTLLQSSLSPNFHAGPYSSTMSPTKHRAVSHLLDDDRGTFTRPVTETTDPARATPTHTSTVAGHHNRHAPHRPTLSFPRLRTLRSTLKHIRGTASLAAPKTSALTSTSSTSKVKIELARCDSASSLESLKPFATSVTAPSIVSFPFDVYSSSSSDDDGENDDDDEADSAAPTRVCVTPKAAPYPPPPAVPIPIPVPAIDRRKLDFGCYDLEDEWRRPRTGRPSLHIPVGTFDLADLEVAEDRTRLSPASAVFPFDF